MDFWDAQKRGSILITTCTFGKLLENFLIACRTGIIALRFAGEREGDREARGERGLRVTRDGIRTLSVQPVARDWHSPPFARKRKK